MRLHEIARPQLVLLGATLSLGVLFGACSTDEEPAPAPAGDASTDDPDASADDPDGSTDGPDGTSVDPDGSSDGPDSSGDASVDPVDGSTEDPVEPIGNETGDPVSLDHATAFGAVEANLKKHIDGLEAALKFLEDSDSVNNVVDMLFEDDDDEDEGEGPAEAEPEEDEDEGLEIDLAELRDDIVEMVADYLMVESTATEAADGLSLTYDLDPKILCDEEPEEDESDEMKTERLEDEADCEDRMGNNPIRIVVTSDGDHRMDLSIRAGTDEVEVLVVQVHDDMMSVTGNLPHAQTMLQAFVDPDDFTLPETMEGMFACEVREDASLVYTVRCAVTEAIDATPGDDQEPFSLQLAQMDAPLSLTIDGAASTIAGALTSEAVTASLPWQIIVDMFWDDEGYSEWVCEPNGDGGENCWDEWIEPPESPEVDNAFIVAIPGVAGALGYAASDDTFRLMDVSLGGSTTTVKVDADTIVSFDLSPESDYLMSMDMSGDADENMEMVFSPSMEPTATFAWDQIKEDLDDPPDFLMDESLGIRFQGSETPTLAILVGEEETQLQVASGELTLWSSAMDDDVVISEGQCITGVDEDNMTEEEKEAQHDLFGGLVGATCEP